MGCLKTVVCNSDMADLPLFLCFQHSLIQSASVSRLRAKRRIVELIQIHILRLKILKGQLQILPKLLSRLSHGFRCKIDLIPYSGECFPQLFFTVRIKSGRIEEVHTAFAGSS